MAVSKITTAAVQAISNQVLTIAGALTTEGSARPGFLTAIEIEAYQSSDSQTTQAAQVYVKCFDNALSTDVNGNHTTGLVVAVPVPTRATSGRLSHKYIFPGRGIPFTLGIQACIDTTIAGNTGASGTSLPNAVKFFFTEV